ncbi:MAG TPA: sulfite exporter TauE/SafE family protein [Gaiellaceae bacterium]|nr:sulfite exporter TauE/SafE family protein [Gaiellaceae bacterium]
MPPATPSLWILGGIGIASGFLSALFGVGGGIVIVPLLVLLAGFDSRVATATSLAAILVTAIAGVTSFSLLDHVDWDAAALVGVPAVAGSLAGVRLQQRVSSRRLTLLFALFILAVAVALFVE